MRRAIRVLAAAMILIGGAIHLNLWVAGYRGIPYIGPMFFANVIGSAAIGLVVATGTRRTTALAGVAFSAGSVLALLIGRTVGLFGFMEGWTGPALQTLAAEMCAVVLLALALGTATPGRPVLVPISVRGRRHPRP